MCFKNVIEIITKPVEVSIPHPEESPDYTKTIENTSITDVLDRWFNGWKVPEEYWDYWKSAITIYISILYAVPAATSSETKEMWLRPEWASPGVVAHEEAHISYLLLDEDKKREYFGAFIEALLTDNLAVVSDDSIRKLWSQDGYAHYSIIEAHADVYRYLGEQMPENLKQYYPKLF